MLLTVVDLPVSGGVGRVPPNRFASRFAGARARGMLEGNPGHGAPVVRTVPAKGAGFPLQRPERAGNVIARATSSQVFPHWPPRGRRRGRCPFRGGNAADTPRAARTVSKSGSGRRDPWQLRDPVEGESEGADGPPPKMPAWVDDRHFCPHSFLAPAGARSYSRIPFHGAASCLPVHRDECVHGFVLLCERARNSSWDSVGHV